jgi:undecaprenyl-diphosphatase
MILGVIQGATEFLPVSSSGHLALGKHLLADGRLVAVLRANPLALDVLLHLATLLAVALFYRHDIRDAIRGWGRSLIALKAGHFKRHLLEDDSACLAWAVVVGTLPTGVLGVLMADVAVTVSATPILLGSTFLACAVLLLATRFFAGGTRRLSLGLALAIGTIQGVAVLPGISRSGATIALALALGMPREEAARFSFLLSLPAILGAAILELDIDALGASGRLTLYLMAAGAAFSVGILALALLVHLVRRGRLWLFAPYVAAAGLFSICCLG